ncbi:MAG: cation diffusion facilitator family transporter [Motiliproteus sp.]
MSHSSKKAVLTAIVSNSIVTVIKFIAAVFSGSASMMNEAIHSLMDTLNQLFLLRGLAVAERPADQYYAFGHGQKKYLWNLWSAIGLFSIGCGLGLAHAWHSYHAIDQYQPSADLVIAGFSLPTLWLTLGVLAVAFLLEGYSFMIAFLEFIRRMRSEGRWNPFRYLLHCEDATLVAVVLEDSVAMIGLVLASAGILMTAQTGNPIWDIGFSSAIAAMLGLIAFYLGYINMRYLADLRDHRAEQLFRQVIKEHKEVDQLHDLRSIIIDENYSLLVADIELREEVILAQLQPRIAQRSRTLLAELPLERQQQPQLIRYIEARAAVEMALARTEEIARELEQQLKQLLPRVGHVTLEVSGLSPPPADEAAKPNDAIEPNDSIKNTAEANNASNEVAESDVTGSAPKETGS